MAENDDSEFEKLLNDFINNQLEDVDIDDTLSSQKKTDVVHDVEVPQENIQVANFTQDNSDIEEEDPELDMLDKPEKALFKAYRNFEDALNMIAKDNNLSFRKFRLQPMDLTPHYKPSRGKIIAEDFEKGWDVLIKAYPDIVGQFSLQSTDEQLLDFAEKLQDDTLQFAIISYVESLIEMEGCEIAYKERKLKREKKRLEREIYLQHQQRIDLMNKYINAINQKEFPIDADRLVKNYFKTARKDADGAYKVLTNNPAVFAPIQVDKIKPRFFGFIKVKPQDGIRMNRIIGAFLKKLKA